MMHYYVGIKEGVMVAYYTTPECMHKIFKKGLLTEYRKCENALEQLDYINSFNGGKENAGN